MRKDLESVYGLRVGRISHLRMAMTQNSTNIVTKAVRDLLVPVGG